MSFSRTVLPEDLDFPTPNHMILWLDVTIGKPGEYRDLKKAFGSNTDPRHQTWTSLKDEDFENLLRVGEAVPVQFEGVYFLLQAFDNINSCIQAFHDNQDKRIFFIVSGTMGEQIVPRLIAEYQHVFTDPITNDPYTSIYIFCHNIAWQIEWTMDYLEYVLAFNFDSELLARLTRDIGEYFVEKGKRLRQDNHPKEVLQHFHWAKMLCHRYDKLEGKNSVTKRNEIERLIEETTRMLPPKPTSDDACVNPNDVDRSTSCDACLFNDNDDDDEKCAVPSD